MKTETKAATQADDAIQWLGCGETYERLRDLYGKRFVCLGGPTTLYFKMDDGTNIRVPMGWWIVRGGGGAPFIASNPPTSSENYWTPPSVLADAALLLRRSDPEIAHKLDALIQSWPSPLPPRAPKEQTMTHDLKTWPDPFAAILDGRKRYEIRKADRPFAEGDTLRLREWNEQSRAMPYGYTGREVTVRVTYMSPPGAWGLPADLCVMGIAPASAPPEAGVARVIGGVEGPCDHHPGTDEHYHCVTCGCPVWLDSGTEHECPPGFDEVPRVVVGTTCCEKARKGLVCEHLRDELIAGVRALLDQGKPFSVARDYVLDRLDDIREPPEATTTESKDNDHE